MGKHTASLGEQAAASHFADNMESGRGRGEGANGRGKGGRKPGGKPGGSRLGRAVALLGAALFLGCYALFTSHTTFSIHSVPLSGMHGMHRFGDGTAHTLIIYVYAHTDVEYEENLLYFLEFGVQPGDGCDYLIVVQEGKGVLDTKLPPLPDNVHAVPHTNECFDWGTFGWAIEKGVVDTSRYTYIIFLNSSVRGPFLPSYWPPGLHWSQVLTQRITADTKLVGATISCEGANQAGVLTGKMRRNPHVQSYVVATDQVGLGLLQQDGRVLSCYKSIHDAIWYAEMGSSAAILGAGYNIDSLMLRYQGVDWRLKHNWGCNEGINPYAEYMYDGVNISPFEVMFVKVKEFLLEAGWMTASSAKKYTAWVRHETNLTANEYTLKRTMLRNMKILNMRARGSACFDFEFYKAHNPDLPVWGPETIWEHFVTSGQHEGRVFRFRCKAGAVEWAKPPPPPKPLPPSLSRPPLLPPPSLPPPVVAAAALDQQTGLQQHASAAEQAAAQAAAAAAAAADAAAAAQAAAAAAQREQAAAAAAGGGSQQAVAAEAAAAGATATQAADVGQGAAAGVQHAEAGGGRSAAADTASGADTDAVQQASDAALQQATAAQQQVTDAAAQQLAAQQQQAAAAATAQAVDAVQQAVMATQQQAALAVQQLAQAEQAAAIAGAEQRRR
ncbi:hypothetical protein D9Q98_004565 [Chlorella vulgaris]|uniref:Uncharacterized protein n=1 Tax=Chlorella vulgaris TaxID=3077 RepID=A0A9D4TQ43_CHLVU|nr:hypothetical protein D9Q98_004565 [Chlorella vulgaris]